MYAILDKQTGLTISVSAAPVYEHGMWECGDQRFTDPTKTHYEPVPVFEPMTPMTFYLAFTVAERLAIKTNPDPIIVEFWDTYQRAERTGTNVDPNLASVVNGLTYLFGKDVLAEQSRIDEIRAGIAQ